jgi:hypothetical protein
MQHWRGFQRRLPADDFRIMELPGQIVQKLELSVVFTGNEPVVPEYRNWRSGELEKGGVKESPKKGNGITISW